MDSVTEVLQARSHESGGLTQTALLSLLAHGAAIAGLVLMPSPWRNSATTPPVVMTISLGGTPGPNQGMTTEGGRPVQAAPPEAQPSRRAEPAPAPKAPAMVRPVPDPKVKPRPAPKHAPDQAKSATASKGEETRPGSTRTDTGARGLGFGLSTGGGGTGGGYLDVGNFCCPEYLITMTDLIRRNWNPRQEVAGDVLLKFVIQRNGQITAVEVERSSGFAALDLNSQRALLLTRQLPWLPSAFPDDHLTVHLSFQYQR